MKTECLKNQNETQHSLGWVALGAGEEKSIGEYHTGDGVGMCQKGVTYYLNGLKHK